MTGAEFRARRLAVGVTAVAVARRLGVHPTTVWRWEHGKRGGGGGGLGVPAAAVEALQGCAAEEEKRAEERATARAAEMQMLRGLKYS